MFIVALIANYNGTYLTKAAAAALKKTPPDDGVFLARELFLTYRLKQKQGRARRTV
jgi:hypothetical protein